MYTHDWIHADQVVCTPPSPEHLVAAGILACALGTEHVASGQFRPAPIQVVSPIGEASALLKRWTEAPQRPRLWLIALDAASITDADANNAVKMMTRLGARILIGPTEVEPDPAGRVVRRLQDGIGRSVDSRWQHLAKTAARRIQLVRRALQPTADQTSTPLIEQDRRQALALAAALPVNQVRAYTQAWNAGGQAWDQARAGLGITDDRWHSPLIAALHAIDADPADMVWHLQVIGFSATTQRLRAKSRSAADALAAGQGAWLVAHDRVEAIRLAAVIGAVAGGDPTGTISDDPEEAPLWHIRSPPRTIALVDPSDERSAYAAAAAAAAIVVDVPPLDERSMDIPHIALAELWRLHRTAGRPGAPRAGVDMPEQLAWLSTRSWPDGIASLRTWLRNNLELDPGGSWINGDQNLPVHPGLDGSLCLGHALTLDTATAQIVRWALGAHSQQRTALQRLGVGTYRLPGCVVDKTGRPRRVIRTSSGSTDPWVNPLPANP